MKRIDHTGDRFGRLLVLYREGSTSSGEAKWRCECDCGNESVVAGSKLRNGHTSSCGCLSAEVASATHSIHNMNGSPTWKSYSAMKQRCMKEDHQAYPRYGGRGITICDRWLERNGFINFVEDMGERPDGKSLDRIDTNGNYSPKNCKWSDESQQARNSRASRWWFVGGVRYPSQRAAGEALGVSYSTVRRWCGGRRTNCWSEPKYI